MRSRGVISGHFNRRSYLLWTVSALFLIVVLITVLDLQGINSPALKKITNLQVPGADHRLLIISPHPDDESLGAGGLIAEAVANGDQVKVVFMTNGDGFSYGVERYFHLLHPNKKSFLNYGRQRQQEALAATAALGVRAGNALFLGFPDRGTYPIWRSYWSPGQPYTSRSTGQSGVAYQLAVDPGAPYEAPVLLSNLEAVMKDYRPTDIYVTDTSDIHPDHLAAGAFTLAAAAEVQGEDPSFAPNIYSFVIHTSSRQALPVLKGDQIIVPPGYFLDQGNGWYKLPLTTTALAAKTRAIAAYRTQQLVMHTFLDNFERPNELFCLQRQRRLASLDPGSLSGSRVVQWPDAARISFNTEAVPGSLKSNDLRSAYIARSRNDIYLRLNTLGRLGLADSYTVSAYLLPGRSGEPVQRFAWQVTPLRKRVVWLAKPAGYDSSGVSFTYSHNQIDMVLPDVIAANDQYLMFNDDTVIERIPMAQVPWCLLKL